MNPQQPYKRHFPAAPAFMLIAALALGGVVMWLWNAILPSLLNTGTIKYWQAVGLLLLCRILFGNFGGRMGGPGRWNRDWKNGGGNFPNGRSPFERRQWRGKWMNMTDEERKQFRDEMKRRCRKPPERGNL